MFGKALLGALALVLLNSAALAAVVTIDPDRMLVVDGRRAFVLGLYETPKDDELLEEAAGAGFNLVRVPADAAELDRMQGQGLWAWLNVGTAIDLSENRAAREAKLSALVDSYAPHPALLVWEVPDEALWNCWHRPLDWRRGSEPQMQGKKIAALDDEKLAKELRAMRVEADRLFARGDFAGYEELVDAIWGKLGEEPPHPELKITQSRQNMDTMQEGYLEGYKVFKRLDPHHPIWMNHAPRNQQAQLAAFNEAADIVGCDIYPVPAYGTGHSDLANRDLCAVGAYTDIMQAAAPRKPTWMVLQGFGWADLQTDPAPEVRQKQRRPKFDESRFMAYDAIVHGARGILYWGTHCVEKDSILWRDLLRLARELADRQPVLAAPDAALDLDVTIAPTWGSVDRGILVLPKDVDGKVWLLVVNEFSDPLRYTIHNLNTLEGVNYHDPDDRREAEVKGGVLTLDIAGHGVQVLEPRLR